MKDVKNKDGKKIGTLQRNIVHSGGTKLYRIEDDNKVWVLVKDDRESSIAQREHYTVVGNFKDNKCITDNGEIVFIIE